MPRLSDRCTTDIQRSDLVNEVFRAQHVGPGPLSQVDRRAQDLLSAVLFRLHAARDDFDWEDVARLCRDEDAIRDVVARNKRWMTAPRLHQPAEFRVEPFEEALERLRLVVGKQL